MSQIASIMRNIGQLENEIIVREGRDDAKRLGLRTHLRAGSLGMEIRCTWLADPDRPDISTYVDASRLVSWLEMATANVNPAYLQFEQLLKTFNSSILQSGNFYKSFSRRASLQYFRQFLLVFEKSFPCINGSTRLFDHKSFESLIFFRVF